MAEINITNVKKNPAPHPKEKGDISTGRKIFNQIATYCEKPDHIILIVFGILLTLGIIAPMISLITDSFTIHAGFESIFSEKKVGTTYPFGWLAALNQNFLGLSEVVFWVPLGRSLITGVLSCIFALLFGGVAAYLVTRTNRPCKSYISTIFIFPYIRPQWTLAIVWKYLFWSGQNKGETNGILANWGIHCPSWFTEGLFPTSLILGIHYAAFAYRMIGNVFKNRDSNLEEAATILNTPKWKIFLRVTIPRITPAILSTILLVFSNAIGSYPIPYYLHYDSLAVQYRLNKKDYPSMAAVIALVRTFIGLIILFFNTRSSRSRKQYTTVTGKAGQVEPVNLGKIGRWVAAAILIILTACTAIYPIISFALQTLLPNPNDFSSGLTTIWWVNKDNTNSQVRNELGILYNKTIWKAFGNTVKVGLICALCAGTIGNLIGYAVSKNRKSRFAQYVNAMAFIPYLLPSIGFGAAFAVLGGKRNIRGTTMLFVLVGTIKYIPFSSRSSLNARSQLSGEIEEAAIIQNASWPKRRGKIIIPIQKSSFISGYTLPLITCTRELSLFVRLSTDSTSLLTLARNHYDEIGVPARSSACNLIIIIFVLAANLIVQWSTGSRLDGGVASKSK